MTAIFTSLKLFRLHPRLALWLVPVYILLCLIFALDEKQLLIFMCVMIIGHIQGLMLKQSFSRESAFLLPEHHKVQLLVGFFLGLLLALPAALALLLFKKSGVASIPIWLFTTYALATGLGYYRRGDFGFILFIIYFLFTFEYVPSLNTVLQISPVYLFVNAGFIAGIYLLIFRAMNNQEFVRADSRNSLIFGWNKRVVQSSERNTGESLLGKQFSDNGKIPALSRFYLRTLSLPRKLAIYGEDAAYAPWLSTTIAALSVGVAAAMTFFSASEMLIAMVLLLPLIAIVAPYINELSESRSRIARFWLKDDSNSRRQFMIRIVRGHILRLCYPFLLWCVVVSAGRILLDVDSRWANLYLAGLCALVLGCMLGFFGGLLQGRLSLITNSVLRVVYTFAAAGCMLMAWLFPLHTLYLTGGFVIFTFIAVTFWVRQDLELASS